MKLQGWSELELGARYATQIYGRKAVVRLNVANVFNRKYYSGVFRETTPVATLGAGRTVSLSLQMDF